MSRRDGASRTARKVALNVLSLGSKPGMEDILPAGIVEATARLLVAADVVGEGAVRFARTRTAVAIYEAFGDGFDLVMMVFGQFNVFQRNRAMEILAKAHAALRTGGRLLLELQAAEQIRKGGKVGPSWYSAPSGLFSDRPHVVLQENFWDDEAAASTTRFMVIDAVTGAVSRYALSNEAYTEEELDDALRSVGFGEMRSFPSLRGRDPSRETDLPVVVALR